MMSSVKLTYPSACCLRAHMEHLWPRISGAATHDATQWNQKQVAGRLQIRELSIGFPLSSQRPRISTTYNRLQRKHYNLTLPSLVPPPSLILNKRGSCWLPGESRPCRGTKTQAVVFWEAHHVYLGPSRIILLSSKWEAELYNVVFSIIENSHRRVLLLCSNLHNRWVIRSNLQ